MPVIEPETSRAKKALFTARVDPSVVEMLRACCEFLNSSHRGLVSAVLAVGVSSFGHLPVRSPATNAMLVLVAANAHMFTLPFDSSSALLWFKSLVRAVVRLCLPLAPASRRRSHHVAALPAAGPLCRAVPRSGRNRQATQADAGR